MEEDGTTAVRVVVVMGEVGMTAVVAVLRVTRAVAGGRPR